MALKQRELEPTNEVIRGETIEEIVTSGDGIIVSFRGSVPDLLIEPNPEFLRSPGDDLKLSFLE